MNCLKGYIGIRNSDLPEPDGGMYINELPGITLENIDRIASDEKLSYRLAWSDVENRASKKMEVAISNSFAKRYRIKSLQQTIDVSRFTNPAVTFAPAAKYRGFKIQLTQDYRLRASLYQSFHVQSINLYLKAATAGVPVKVFNNYTGELLYSTEIDGVEGWNEIKVKDNFNAQALFVCYDASTVEGTSLPIKDFVNSWFVDCCRSICSSWSPIMRGVETDSLTIGSDQELGYDTYGISAVFSVRCSWDNLVCNNKELFATAWQNLLGAEIMIERIGSDRKNRFTTVDLDKARELRDYFEAEADKYLALTIEGISIDTGDTCLECNAALQVKEVRL